MLKMTISMKRYLVVYGAPDGNGTVIDQFDYHKDMEERLAEIQSTGAFALPFMKNDETGEYEIPRM